MLDTCGNFTNYISVSVFLSNAIFLFRYLSPTQLQKIAFLGVTVAPNQDRIQAQSEDMGDVKIADYQGTQFNHFLFIRNRTTRVPKKRAFLIVFISLYVSGKRQISSPVILVIEFT